MGRYRGIPPPQLKQLAPHFSTKELDENILIRKEKVNFL